MSVRFFPVECQVLPPNDGRYANSKTTTELGSVSLFGREYAPKFATILLISKDKCTAIVS